MNFSSTTLRVLLATFALTLLEGCAHSIVITPDSSKLPVAGSIRPANHAVGYYVSDEERTRRVITPGGGGDKIEYAPYKDLEPGIYRVLNNLFSNVYVLKSMDDNALIAEKSIRYVLRPKITTNSSSSGVFTWPPTDFTVIMEITAFDNTGRQAWKDALTGEGKAEFSEFKSDFALAAKRASEHALSRLQEKIASSPLMR